MIVLKVNIHGEKQVQGALKRVGKFPEMTCEAMRDWGKTLQRNMVKSAKQANIKPFTGELFTEIEWRQAPKGRTGALFIPLHGVQLDSMSPHFVNIKRSRTRFLSWGLNANSHAIRAGSNNVAAGITKRYAIRVSPHPFIRNGYNVTRPLLIPMIRRRLAQAA